MPQTDLKTTTYKMDYEDKHPNTPRNPDWCSHHNGTLETGPLFVKCHISSMPCETGHAENPLIHTKCPTKKEHER